MSKETTSAAIDLMEIHDLIEKAGGMFSWAAETLEQVEAVLETIRKETPESRVRHLAELARDACEERCQTFFDLRDEFNCKSDDLRALLCPSK